MPGVRRIVPVLVLFACRDSGPPEFCEARTGDADCDGVPEDRDQCPDSVMGELTDPVGCTATQSAGCQVRAIYPLEREVVRGSTLFSWDGDCDVYLLQFADDDRFPPAATRTAVRTTGTEATTAGDERFWRVVGGLVGGSAGAATPAREVEWR